jgi:hypothetical protein
VRQAPGPARDDDHVGSDALRRGEDLRSHVADRLERLRLDLAGRAVAPRLVERPPLPVELADDGGHKHAFKDR